MIRHGALILSALTLGALTACDRGGDSADTASACLDICGDVDGDGGDTGDVPNVLGNWTSDFGKNLFSHNCTTVDGMNAGSDFWIDGSMEIKGRLPDNLYITFDDGSEEKFFGVIAPNGAVSFAGQHEDRHGTWNLAVGGLAYDDVYRDRYYIDGFVFIGLDFEGDGSIECSARGEWTAAKSGA